jgi:DNA-binding GntR family transcriptional regulator
MATPPGVAHLPHELGIDTTRRSSGEAAALYIRRLIFDGVIKPGSRVPQDDVAEALGISRIPVREALIALEREAWVTIELHRGAFVNALDAVAVRDHYELYGLMYGFAARRALARTAPAELGEQLRDVLARADTSDPAAFGKAAYEFHRTLVDAARSQRLKVVIRSLAAIVPGDFFSLVPGAMEDERRSLPTIARAVERADAERAAAEYATMMRRVGERVVDVLAERGLFEAAAKKGRRVSRDGQRGSGAR